MAVQYAIWDAAKSLNVSLLSSNREVLAIAADAAQGFSLSDIIVADSFVCEFRLKEQTTGYTGADIAVGLVTQYTDAGATQTDLTLAENIMYRNDGVVFDQGVQVTAGIPTANFNQTVSVWRDDFDGGEAPGAQNTVHFALDGVEFYSTNVDVPVYRKVWMGDGTPTVQPRVANFESSTLIYPNLYPDATNKAFILVTGVPIFTTQPTSQTVEEGSEVVFTCIADASAGGGTVTYQWYNDVRGEMVGYTGTTLTMTARGGFTGIGVDGWRYYCVATDNNGSNTSGQAVLTVTPFADPPVITLQPGYVIIGPIPPYNLINQEVTATTTSGNTTYEWYEITTYDGLSLLTGSVLFNTPTISYDYTAYPFAIGCVITDTTSGEYTTTVVFTPKVYADTVPETLALLTNPVDVGQELTTVILNWPTSQTGNYEVTWYDVATGNILPAEAYQQAYIIPSASSGDNGRVIKVNVDAVEFEGKTPYRSAEITLMVNPPPPPPIDNVTRTALVWNFEDDNYTWMDAGFDTGTQIEGAVSTGYMFNPGWQTRWADLDAGSGGVWDGVLWGPDDDPNNLQDLGTLWSDFYSHGSERNMYMMTSYGLYRGDQVVKTDGVKQYFLTKVDIDLDQFNPDWATNSFKHLRQFYFHGSSDRTEIGTDPNNFLFTTGWSKNLMDPPAWGAPTTVNMQKTADGGTWKIDLRETGRYLSINLFFNTTLQFKMTGGDMDMEEAHGR